MNRNKQKKGFTIMEVLVSMAVLTLVIFSATNLVVSIIRNNVENIDTLIAYGLAQEGVEAVRNIRDSDWLLGARYDGTLGKNKVEVWGSSFPSGNREAYYILDYGKLDSARTAVGQTIGSLATPWKLTEIPANEIDSSKTIINKFDTPEGTVYNHNNPKLGITVKKETPFHRYLVLENISTSGEMDQFRVRSVVKWNEYGRDKEVELVTDLTDWNQGQI